MIRACYHPTDDKGRWWKRGAGNTNSQSTSAAARIMHRDGLVARNRNGNRRSTSSVLKGQKERDRERDREREMKEDRGKKRESYSPSRQIEFLRSGLAP